MAPFDESHDATPAPRHIRPSRGPVLLALFLLSAVGLRGTADEHRAHLSDDLTRVVAAGSASRVRVIMHGSRSDLRALAAR